MLVLLDMSLIIIKNRVQMAFNYRFDVGVPGAVRSCRYRYLCLPVQR